MADCRTRLERLGYQTNGDKPEEFGKNTQEAIRLFQASRNLEVDGICGPNTWASLIEASWKLGDRLLYRRQPMLRGDDVAELQKQFNMLGFDTCRIDGIFGDATLSALTEFQRNVGIRSDGVVGPRTIDELKRMIPRHESNRLVSEIKEVERWKDHTGRRNLRIMLCDSGGAGICISSISKLLLYNGVQISMSHSFNQQRQAHEANAFDADLCIVIGLEDLDKPSSPLITLSYYSGYNYVSLPAKSLVEEIERGFERVFGPGKSHAEGLSLPVLRETKMPTLVCTFTSPSFLLQNLAEITEILDNSVLSWSTSTIKH